MSIGEWLVGFLDSAGKANVGTLVLIALGSLVYGFFWVGRDKQ